MEYQLSLQIVSDTGQISTHNIINLKKDSLNIASIGLSLDESKSILQSTQQAIVEAQIQGKIANYNFCGCCKANLHVKGYRKTTFRTLFGDIKFKSPRYLSCSYCKPSGKSFTPLSDFFGDYVSPELYYMETKWSSLLSYGASLNLLKDCLPINNKLSIKTIRQHTYKIARKIESTIGEEHYIYALELPLFVNKYAYNNEKATMRIDGGYLRFWENKKKNFAVIVGKCIPRKGAAKSFGFVQTIDQKAKRRVYDVLQAQGITNQHGVCFMSDGNDNLRRLQRNLSPNAKHILEWFHITMRITVLGQYIKGLININSAQGNDIKNKLDSIKYKLWHGKTIEAIDKIEDLTWDVAEFKKKYKKYAALAKYLDEFHVYICNNMELIVNYGKRWRKKKRISTAFIESLVNSLLNKRFCKRQQMQWKKENAHLLLQTRVAVINQELTNIFRNWYPEFRISASNDEEINLKKVS